MTEERHFWAVTTDKFSGFLYSIAEVVEKVREAEWADVEKIKQSQ